jgi:hypothetical protein
MRPVNKGDWPSENVEPIEFAEYGDARSYLIDRLGDYCSYCENQITNPAVEHEQPKNVAPGIERSWYNFLLACINCNSIKGHDLLNLDEFYWPDIHNTFLLFEFHPLGAVTVKTNLPASVDKNRADRTLKLTGLNRYGKGVASDADRRWVKRSQAYGKAEDALRYFVNNNRPNDYILSITNTATSTGFWSVWMRVFENEQDVIIALIGAFLNTFENCELTNIDRL